MLMNPRQRPDLKQTKANAFMGKAFSLWGRSPRVVDRRFLSCCNKAKAPFSHHHHQTHKLAIILIDHYQYQYHPVIIIIIS